MSMIIDHQLREQILHDTAAFPITYFRDELVSLPNRAGPLHWHPDFEITTAEIGVIEVQVGHEHLTLDAGDSIFVNRNVLHGIRQISGDVVDPMPVILFSGAVIAPETSAVYQKYIQPIAACDLLPFIVFRRGNGWQDEANRLIKGIYQQLHENGPCYEMAVQRYLSSIFEAIFRHFDALPKSQTSRIQIKTQIRLQQMLAYIYTHYPEPVTLDEIAGAASISRSEAGRCFNAYMGCSPIEALIQYRLQKAHHLLHDSSLTLQEISDACGFNSVNYFSRQFRKTHGCTPGQNRGLGK